MSDFKCRQNIRIENMCQTETHKNQEKFLLKQLKNTYIMY